MVRGGRRLSIALALSAFTAPLPALADPTQSADRAAELPLFVPRPEFSDRPVHLMGVVGFGTLVGFAGVTAGYNLHDRLEVGAGLGVNAMSRFLPGALVSMGYAF